jgi:leucyl aminopeptidase
MENMYDDKAGACTVLEAFHAIVELNIPINLVCTVALVENSIGTDAYRVSDIIKSYKGLTVEILNTDAEGRLILADAMSYT